MVYFQFIAEHYSLLALFLLVSYIVGKVILSDFGIADNINKMFFFTASGVGAVTVIVFYVALLKHFDKNIVLLLVLPFLVIYLGKNRFFLLKKNTWLIIGDEIRIFCKRNWCWAIFASVILAPFLLLPLYPPTHWDELTYHLPYARYYVENHGLVVNPFLRYPLYAHNVDLLYSVALLFSDDILAHLIHASAAGLTALGIYNLGMITADKRTGILSSLIFLSSPLVVYLMKSSYIDLGLTLFVFLSFYCLSLWEITKRDFWLYFSGFAAGIAAGSKYSGLFYIPIFVIWIALSSKKPSAVIKFLVLVIIFGSPWYIRNFIISGDPISPFGGNVFGYWLWNKQDLIGQSEDLLKAHGTARDLISLIKLPMNLLLHPDKYMEGLISPWMVFIFPAILVFRRFNKFNKHLSVFVFVNILIWFYTSQILRYLLPVFPMMSLLAAVVLIYLYDNFLKILQKNILSKISFRFYVSKAIHITASFIFIMPLLYNDVRILQETSRSQLPVTEQARHKYLQSETQSFYLTDIANNNPSNNIYQIGFETAYYFAKGKIIGDWFGPARYSIIFDLNGNSEQIYKRLRSINIKYFLVNTKKVLPLKFDGDFEDYFKLVAEDDVGKLYELKNLEELKGNIFFHLNLDASGQEVLKYLAQIHEGS